MTPILYTSSESAYATNGLGRLSDAISCVVTEELNGAYEMEMQYPAAGIHAALITEGCQIYAAHDETGDRQPFRIYRRTDTIDGVFTVFARHISGDLSRIPVMPFYAGTLSEALTMIGTNSVVTNPFTFTTALTVVAQLGVTVPTSAKAVLGSGEGSILGVYGGEVEYDKRTVTIVARRGTDTDVVVRYGKNMTGLEVVSEAAAAFNAVVPFCDTQNGLITCTPPVVSHGAYTDAVPLDLSDAFDYVPSPAQLESAALAWLNQHQPWIAEKAITVSFVQLRDTTEYADFAPLEQLALGDGIKVKHAQLGVDADFRIIKTVYDAIQDRYAEVMLGREIVTVASMMSEMMTKLAEARDIAQEIANGTYTGGTFINGEMIYSPHIYGGQIFIGDNGSGYNFEVDGAGNVVTNGSVHLQGPDTKIIAPLILSNSFSVFPQDATEQEIEDVGVSAGFNLYGHQPGSPGVLYKFMQIYQYDVFTHFASGAGGSAYWDFGSTDFTGNVDIIGTGRYLGSGQSGANAELATQGDIANFVTASQVQDMIDAAIGPQP